MRMHGFVWRFLGGCLLASAGPSALASEYAFSSYGLGGSAFGVGVTPPAGTYVTAVTGFYSGKSDGTVNFGNVTLNAGAKVEGFTSAANLLYVPERKFLGGNFGLSVTVPVGHVDIDATVGIPPGPAISREADGWGLGDIVSKAQLGWQHGEIAHTIYVQAVAPTGRWDPELCTYHRPPPARHRHRLGVHLAGQGDQTAVKRGCWRHVQLREYRD